MNPNRLIMMADIENGTVPKLVRAAPLYDVDRTRVAEPHVCSKTKLVSLGFKKVEASVTFGGVISFDPVISSGYSKAEIPGVVYRVPPTITASLNETFLAPASHGDPRKLIVVTITELDVKPEPDAYPPMWLVQRVRHENYNRLVEQDNERIKALLALQEKADARQNLIDQLAAFPDNSPERAEVLRTLGINDPVPGMIHGLPMEFMQPPPFVQPPPPPPPPASIPPRDIISGEVPKPPATPVSAPWVGQPHGNFDKDDKNVDINKL